MSQLLDHGHRYAESYYVGKVWEENQLVVDRINRNHATSATVLSAVMTAAVASFGKKGRDANKALADLIKDLNGDG